MYETAESPNCVPRVPLYKFCFPINLNSKSFSAQSTRYLYEGFLFFFPTEIHVELRRGLPTVTVPLPSRRELCQFTLRPVTNTVGDFTYMLKNEDQGVDRVVVSSSEGVRIASSNTIESLMEEDFRLIINDREFTVKVPPHKKLTKVCRLSLSN